MALINCPECGKEISEQATSCPNCGTPINNSANKKFCQHCGGQIDKDCVICPKCGKQVGEVAGTTNTNNGTSPIIINNNTSASASSSASAVAVGAGPIVYSGKPVNKVIYCLLAFFLGGIGIHKFYAGKTGSGIMFLLFCWTGIPAIIALFNLIGGLLKPADANGNIWL